jgi:hypothetical protein
VTYLKYWKWKVPSIIWSNHEHQQRPSVKWGCTRKKGMQILMFSSTPNSTQEPPGTLHPHLALIYRDNKEVPCIVTASSFSWIRSSDE